MTGIPLRGPPTPMKRRLYLRLQQSQHAKPRSRKNIEKTKGPVVIANSSNPNAGTNSEDIFVRLGLGWERDYSGSAYLVCILRQGLLGHFADPELLIAWGASMFENQSRVDVVVIDNNIRIKALSTVGQNYCSTDVTRHLSDRWETTAHSRRSATSIPGLFKLVFQSFTQHHSLTAPGPCRPNSQIGQRCSLKPINIRLFPRNSYATVEPGSHLPTHTFQHTTTYAHPLISRDSGGKETQLQQSRECYISQTLMWNWRGLAGLMYRTPHTPNRADTWRKRTQRLYWAGWF